LVYAGQQPGELPALSVRDHLYDAVQATHEDDESLQDAVLVGFLLIAEWKALSGASWISKISGDHSGELPSWRQRGLASEVVHDFWSDQEEPEEDDDDD